MITLSTTSFIGIVHQRERELPGSILASRARRDQPEQVRPLVCTRESNLAHPVRSLRVDVVGE